MKPADLKSPYPFKKRRPCIQDRIFYIPTYYSSYEEFSLPNWEEIFGNKNPVHIEYCSGNGEWILDRVKENPLINWVAVELKFQRVRQVHSKRVNRRLQNLFIVCGEAQIFTKEYLPKGSVDQVYVNFPDPWPKQRHAKHRLIQAPFMKDLLDSMKMGGHLQLVSDAKFYIEQMKKEIGEVLGWRLFDLDQKKHYGTSYFERLWRSKGRQIYYLEYECNKGDRLNV